MLIPDELLRDVDVLCLDAGGVVVCLDHLRLASLVNASGLAIVDGGVLAYAEGEAKKRLEARAMVTVTWAGQHLAGAHGWAEMVGTMLHVAGVARDRLPSLINSIWADHVRQNLWSKVPDGLPDALQALRLTGVRVALVSNSEGMLDSLFSALGIRACFDFLGDSGVVGVEKPDPAFFAMALAACKSTSDRALHLGDTFATDVLGARAAGIRTALVDPLEQYAGRHPEVPRVPSARAVAESLTVCARSR